MSIVIFHHHPRPSGVLPPSSSLLRLTDSTAAYAALIERRDRLRKKLGLEGIQIEPRVMPVTRIHIPEPRGDPVRKTAQEKRDEMFREMRGRMPKVQGRSGAWADQTKAVQGGL